MVYGLINIFSNNILYNVLEYFSLITQVLRLRKLRKTPSKTNSHGNWCFMPKRYVVKFFSLLHNVGGNQEEQEQFREVLSFSLFCTT